MRHLTEKQKNKRRRLKSQKFLQEYKGSNPCAECGESYHYSVMQFDHVRGEKRMDINAMVRDRHSISSIKKEMLKCELVCANCHAYRTWERYDEGLRTQMDSD